MNQEPPPEKKRRLNLLSRISLYIGIAAITVSALSSICLYINWDVIPEEATGPHPWIGALAWVLLNIMLFAGLPILLLSLISVVVSIFKKSRVINITMSLIGVLTAYAATSTATITLDRVRGASARIYITNLRGLDYALKEHSKEHNSQLPSAVNWCDAVRKFYPQGLRNDLSQNDNGLSNYAFNTNLSEIKRTELSKNTVLLFETQLAKNPAGGPELMSMNNHPLKGCFVLFADMHIAFVRAEDFNNLRWKP
jgi:hypothetical protein